MEKGKMFVEKRQYKRVEKQFKVKYKLIPDSRDTEVIKKEGQSYDISVGGVRIIGSAVGKEDDIIKVEIIVNERSTPVISFAKIRWVKNVGNDTQFRIKFLMLKDEDKKLLEDIIKK